MVIVKFSIYMESEMKSVSRSEKQNFTAKQFHAAKRHFTCPKDGFHEKNTPKRVFFCDVSTKRCVNAGYLHQKCSFWLGFISLLKLLVAILENTLRVSHGSDIVTRLLQPNSF